MDLGLQGRRAVVTGATRGIGRATAALLAAEGARVLAVSRSGDAVDGAEALALDVTAPDAGERVAAWGRVDVLVNNAGTATRQALAALTDEDFQRQWELNVMGPLRLMRALVPGMAQRGWGRVVNVASSSAKRPSGQMAAYSVAKAAMLSLSRVFADAHAADGVLVNAVAPGVTQTPLWTGEGGLADQSAALGGTSRDEALAAAGGNVPLGRMGTAEEVAAVIGFLCSEPAGYVAGAAWSVDGGSVQSII